MAEQASTVILGPAGDGWIETGGPSYRVRVVAGPDVGKEASCADGRLTVGSADDATLVLSDMTVSRYHLELEATAAGIVVRDLDSTNGTRLDKIQIREAVICAGAQLAIGRTRIELIVGSAPSRVRAVPAGSFGPLLGGSAAMRSVYAVLQRAAPTTAPVLITGESGTGKELAARAVHQASGRAGGPLEIVDCGGLPSTLIESELFGHERGAFTGAAARHAGAFERADGGTLLLDELGELPLELQPKLLRALGEGQIRRLGSKASMRVDVRLLAATNRDLRREVNAGRFRADLFYRIAVIQVRMPALRERLDDLPVLVPELLQSIARERGIELGEQPDAALLGSLCRHGWPGNVRELRNYLENMLILRDLPPLPGEPQGSDEADELRGLEAEPMARARARFERHYLRRLLGRTGGNVAEAARQAEISRATFFRLLARHGIKPSRG